MKKEILFEAFENNNWGTFKADLASGEITTQDLETVFYEIDPPPSYSPSVFHSSSDLDRIALAGVKLNILTIAAIKGRTDILDLLFSHGVKVNPANNAALLYAAHYGQTAAVKLLIAQEANINFLDQHGNSALGHAICNTSIEDDELVEIVKLLLSAGANPYLTNNGSESSVENAIRFVRSAKVVSLLVNTDQNLSQMNQQALIVRSKALALATSISSSNSEADAELKAIVDVLLKAGVDVKSKSMGLALSEAAAAGDFQLVEKLLKLGVDPNHSSVLDGSFTPLMKAMVGRRIGVPFVYDLVSSTLAPRIVQDGVTSNVSEIADLSMPIGVPDEHRVAILESRKRYEKPGPHKDVIKLLLQHGAVPGHPKGTNQNRNAMSLAAIMEDQELISLFKSCQNELSPRTGPGSFFVYDIFDRTGISFSEISTRTITRLAEGEQVLHRGNLVIHCDIPKGVQVRVIDGDIIVHGNVKEEVKIFASPLPLVRLRGEFSSVIANHAIKLENGNVTFGGPQVLTGTGYPVGNRVILDGVEFIVPYVQEAPPLLGGKVIIDGNIDDTTDVIASDIVMVNNKRMTTPSPYHLDPDSGELTESYLFFINLLPRSSFSRSSETLELYDNMFAFGKIVEILSKTNKDKLNGMLYDAALYGKIGYLKLLLSKEEIDVNYKPKNLLPGFPETPLEAALRNGHMQAMNLLLAAGAMADKTMPVAAGVMSDKAIPETPAPVLFSVARSGISHSSLESEKKRAITNHELLIQALKKCKTKKDGENNPGPELALRRAAKVGMLDIIKTLVEVVKDLDVNQQGPESGKTALDFARESDNDTVVNFLESIGAISGKKLVM